MERSPLSLATQLIHAGEPSPRIGGAVCMPIFQSANFLYAGETNHHDLQYIRLNNTPNHAALHTKLAAIEGAEAAVVTASGMAAISTALMTFLRAGDHVLAQNVLYGGTYDFLARDLPLWGIDCTFVDLNTPESWRAAVRPNTKVFYVESIGNPLLEVGDLAGVVRFARQHKLVSMVDNTLASPVNFRPVPAGFDLSLHSATKYLNGHSDIVAGAVLGSAEHVRQVTLRLNHLGGALDPHACFLLHRGLKTLALRVQAQNHNAQVLAETLVKAPQVSAVHYPGLPQHRDHARARELFRGCGGVLSFELRGGIEAATRLLQTLRLPIEAPSLGGVETLITRPAATSHSSMKPAERQRAGIAEHLLRVSVGIEATEDLVQDFTQALASL